jgi:hypothetical protein
MLKIDETTFDIEKMIINGKILTLMVEVKSFKELQKGESLELRFFA